MGYTANRFVPTGEKEDRMAQVFTALFNLAMRLERERFLGAGLYERNSDRRGYANGYKPKKLDTTAGTVTVEVPKAAGTGEVFYPPVAGARAPILARGDAGDRGNVREGRLHPRCRQGDGRLRPGEP